MKRSDEQISEIQIVEKNSDRRKKICVCAYGFNNDDDVDNEKNFWALSDSII